MAISDGSTHRDLRRLNPQHRTSGQYIREAGQDGSEKNGGSNAKAPQKRIEILNGWMTDFEEGQSLTFEYQPGNALAVLINDASKGNIKGADFASGLLSIWLGPAPPNDDIKAGLLGESCT